MAEEKEKLQKLLRELFQFNSADLDFGIYRIMNFKRDAIEKFIEKDLIKAVEKGIGTGVLASQSEAVAKLKEVESKIHETLGDKALTGDGVLVDAYRDTPLGKQYLELQAQISGAQSKTSLEVAVFNHLYTFFNRYYDNGDFLSKRRYSRKEKYAVPYNGEEVYLHWANSDQYYVKTGEYFSNYSFKSPFGVTTHFVVLTVDIEKDNIQGDKRFFVPMIDKVEYKASSKEITIPFQYRPLTEQEDIRYHQRNQQDEIIKKALEEIPAKLKAKTDAVAALQSTHHADVNGQQVSLLEFHLYQYKLLVQWSATLLVESMHELRKMELLDADALNSLPLDHAKFGMGTMFEPLFEAVRSAFVSQPLLPRFGGGHLPAASAMIARTQELRELFDTGQISRLFQESGEVAWVNEGITQDRTPELRRYLMQELGVAEMTPESILPRLTQDFLKEQSDVWIVRLYEFLNGQPALLRQNRLADVPLIRLEDGNHVTPRVQGQPQAFLPSPIATDFPTVRRSVCGTEAAKALLASLGLTQPDPVDDVIRHILPRYLSSSGATPQIEYAEDIKRILNAFETDSKSRRESLISALRNCPFIATIDTGSSTKRLAKPSEVYISTERLRDLFDGVSGILLVDDALECLRGEDVRELMEACGATRYLQPIVTESRLSWQDLREMRRRAGCESYTYELGFMDFTLRGLEALLDSLPALSTERAGNKAKILWDALCDAHDRRGDNAFLGTYRWQYYYPRICTFDASFVRLLNERAWVPDKDGKLQPPAFVLFREKGWKQDPFLLSKIDFRPPIIEALAREAGIEPGLLDLLKKLGVTSEDDLKARLGIEREIEDSHENNAGGLTPDEVVSHPLGNTAGPLSSVQGVTEDIISEPTASGEPDSGPASGAGVSGHGSNGGTAIAGSSGHGRTPGSSGGRPFISYIGVHPNNEDPDPDGLMHEQRIALEDKAIAMVLRKEPRLKRMPTNNPGFDLIELGLNGQPNRWIEVKAMTGDLTGRSVGLSHVQFECAREHRNAYWLYVVENASDSAITRILRIQDPAGKAHTFTFDHGWLSVAETADLADPDAPNKTNSE